MNSIINATWILSQPRWKPISKGKHQFSSRLMEEKKLGEISKSLIEKAQDEKQRDEGFVGLSVLLREAFYGRRP